MEKMTKEVLVKLAHKMKFEISEEEYDSFLIDFEVIQKQFELISLVDGLNSVEPISFPYPLCGDAKEDDVRDVKESLKTNGSKKDYLSMSLVDLHNALYKGDITPLELTKLALEKAKKDTNNAFEYICEKEALEAAINLDPSKKENLLWGIPYVLKDNFYVKGMVTTASSDILNDFIPNYDSEVYLRLKAQGAIMIGKSSMDELAMGGLGVTGHLGKIFNPWDASHSHIIGGSSSGSAATCAAGIVPFAIGSDTGDSARKPASYANLVGFKPTWGRISKHGLLAFAQTLDTVGFFTRNVLDSAIILTVLAGKNGKDTYSSPLPVDDYVNAINRDVSGLKIAVIDEIFDSIEDKNVKETFNNVIKDLQRRGAIINHVHMDINLCRAITPAYSILSNSEGAINYSRLDGIKPGQKLEGEEYEELMIANRTKCLSEPIKRRLMIGRYALKEEGLIDSAQRIRHLVSLAVDQILQDNDVIYLPAAPSVAPLFEGEEVDKLSDNFLIADNYLAIANLGGYPSITIPLGFKDGLPFGGNIIGKRFDESTVLGLAKHIEEVVGLADLLPSDK